MVDTSEMAPLLAIHDEIVNDLMTNPILPSIPPLFFVQHSQ